MRLKLAGVYRLKGIGVSCWRAPTHVERQSRWRARRPQLKRDPLGCRRPAMSRLRTVFALPLLTVSLACAPAVQSGARESVVVERLYFGRNLGDALIVTDSAWAAFVTEIVTPRFPAGLTVWSATGQWREPNGRIQREPSFVLELVLRHLPMKPTLPSRPLLPSTRGDFAKRPSFG